MRTLYSVSVCVGSKRAAGLQRRGRLELHPTHATDVGCKRLGGAAAFTAHGSTETECWCARCWRRAMGATMLTCQGPHSRSSLQRCSKRRRQRRPHARLGHDGLRGGERVAGRPRVQHRLADGVQQLSQRRGHWIDLRSQGRLDQGGDAGPDRPVLICTCARCEASANTPCSFATHHIGLEKQRDHKVRRNGFIKVRRNGCITLPLMRPPRRGK